MSKKKKKVTARKDPTPLPVKSAWARGPPQSSFTSPSPRSQSPAPSTPVHSRRPSTLGEGILIKDGVSIPRDNVGAVKQSPAVTFGSIDDVSAPISSSPAAVPPTKSIGVKIVPVATGHVNGKPSKSSRTSLLPPTAPTSTATPSVLSAVTPPVKSKIDLKKMFQNPSSAPSSDPPSDTTSPSMRNVSLPTQQQQPHQGQSPPDPSPQLAQSFTPFVPSNTMRPPQSNDPNGGPTRSPQYPRQMSNGNGTCSQDGQNGGPPAGLSSPRLASHNSQTSTMPQPPPSPRMQPQTQPQMQPMWYYQYPSSDQPHFMPYRQWYNPMQIPPQHQPPPHQPHPGSQMPHTGLPMSPRNSPPTIQGPSIPTPSEEEQNDRLKVEAADKEKMGDGKPEAGRKKKKKKKKAKVAEEICNLEVAARLEKEHKEHRRKQEEERLQKEAEALEELQRWKEGEERRLKLKLKAMQEEKALRLAQERAKEEKERKEKEGQEEQERLLKLAEETRLRLEEEAAAKAKAEAISGPEPEEREEAELEVHKGDGNQDGQLEDDIKTSKSMEGGKDSKDRPKDGLRINTTSINSPTSDKRRLGPLDLTSAIRSASPVVAALATARVIADITTISYPDGYRGPHPGLNQNVKNGKFRYDREFLLQFMPVCKERPATLPPLDAIGLEPVDHTRGGTGHHRPSSAVSPLRQASVDLGFTPALGKSGANNLFSMGNFATMSAGSKLSSKERYANSNRAVSVSGAPGIQYTSPPQPMRHYGRRVSGESVKDITAPAGNVAPASANIGVQDSINRLTDIMVSHLVEDPATTSRNRAIRLLQEQEDGLTTDQKVAMISCFMEDVVAADTYILLTAPELRQSWIHMMLMKRPT